MRASIIDYPREKLAEDIWDSSSGDPVLLEEISDEIEDIVYSFLDDVGIPEEALEDLLVYGSILSNQYNKKTDVDARIVLNPDVIEAEFGDVTGDELYELGESLIHGVLLRDTEHPFNATVVIEGEDTELGQSVLGELEETPLYSVLTSAFLVPPHFVSDEFDPDTELEENQEDAKDEMELLDSLFTELKSDVIDHDWLQEAVGGVADTDKFLGKVQDKVDEINADAVALAMQYGDLRDARYETGKEHSDPGNVLYKILEKYDYIGRLKEVKKLVEDGLTETDIQDLGEVTK